MQATNNNQVLPPAAYPVNHIYEESQKTKIVKPIAVKALRPIVLTPSANRSIPDLDSDALEARFEALRSKPAIPTYEELCRKFDALNLGQSKGVALIERKLQSTKVQDINGLEAQLAKLISR